MEPQAFFPVVVVGNDHGPEPAEWKVWYWKGERLQWQVIALLPVLASKVNLKHPEFRVKKTIFSFKGWFRYLDAASIPHENHLFPPIKSMNASHKTESVEACNRQSWSISTFGLLSLCIWGLVHGTEGKGRKTDCDRTARALLNACVPGIG